MQKKDDTRNDGPEQEEKQLKVIQKKDLWRFRGGIGGSTEIDP